MKKRNLISIILPTYNEAESAGILINHLNRLIIKRKLKAEIIVIDDNSPDGTASKLQEIFFHNKNIRVFNRKNERGLGTAIAFGIKQARGNIIIGMDADGNHPVDIIPKMLQKLDTADLIVASRFVRGGGVKKITERWRNIGSLIFNAIFKILGSPVWDSTSGFYATYKKNIEKLGLARIYYGYGDYHLRLVYFAKKQGFQIWEIPCVYNPRIGGVSKSKLIVMFGRYLGEAIRLRFASK